jgi:nicotinamidase-related amidase
MAEVTLHAKTTALLLQDLQNELIKGRRPVVPLGGAQLIANCQRLLAKARAVGMAVIYVRVARRPDLAEQAGGSCHRLSLSRGKRHRSTSKARGPARQPGISTTQVVLTS